MDARAVLQGHASLQRGSAFVDRGGAIGGAAVIFEALLRRRAWRLETESGPDNLIVRMTGGQEGRGEPAPGDPQTTIVRLDPVIGTDHYRLVTDETVIPVRLYQDGDELCATIGSHQVRMIIRRAPPIPSRRRGAAGPARTEVRAPMPGMVVSVPVQPGQHVKAGDVVAVVEAMKMQMEVPAPVAGIVEDIRAVAGREIAGGHVLVVIAAPAAEGETSDG
jgi:biotin carboxyl carrier protein